MDATLFANLFLYFAFIVLLNIALLIIAPICYVTLVIIKSLYNALVNE